MVLNDMGGEYYCYASDITCSFPVDGRAREREREGEIERDRQTVHLAERAFSSRPHRPPRKESVESPSVCVRIPAVPVESLLGIRPQGRIPAVPLRLAVRFFAPPAPPLPLPAASKIRPRRTLRAASLPAL